MQSDQLYCVYFFSLGHPLPFNVPGVPSSHTLPHTSKAKYINQSTSLPNSEYKHHLFLAVSLANCFSSDNNFPLSISPNISFSPKHEEQISTVSTFPFTTLLLIPSLDLSFSPQNLHVIFL